MPNRLHEIRDPIHGFIRLDDVVTSPSNIYHDSIRGFVPAPGDRNYSYWRTVLRMAALCHDTGHLPFSHAADKDLLPPGIRHEHLSRDLILTEELRPILEDIKVQPADVAKIAVGPQYSDSPFDTRESILYEIIGGNVLGADRIDYLLRGAYHAGVPYGRFDHLRLIDTLRVLPQRDRDSEEPVVGHFPVCRQSGRDRPQRASLSHGNYRGCTKVM